jgi:hypothetical protein
MANPHDFKGGFPLMGCGCGKENRFDYHGMPIEAIWEVLAFLLRVRANSHGSRKVTDLINFNFFSVLNLTPITRFGATNP